MSGRATKGADGRGIPSGFFLSDDKASISWKTERETDETKTYSQKRNHFFEPVRSEKTEFEKKDILLFREFAFLLL